MGLRRVNAFAMGEPSSQHLLSDYELSSGQAPASGPRLQALSYRIRGEGRGLQGLAAGRSEVRAPPETLIGQVSRRHLFQKQFCLNLTKNSVDLWK